MWFQVYKLTIRDIHKNIVYCKRYSETNIHEHNLVILLDGN